MKTIKEINEIAPYHPCEWQQGYGIWQAGYMEGQKGGATEQKAIDIDKACSWLAENVFEYTSTNGGIFLTALLDDFSQAMEE